MAKLKNNVMLQFSIITSIIIAICIIISALTISHELNTYYIKLHVEMYPSLVEIHINHHEEVFSFFEKSVEDPIPLEVELIFRELLSNKSIFRIKVWNNKGTILWSDKKDLIGKNFPENQELFHALNNGVVSQKLSRAGETEEYSNENLSGLVLEIYIPVLYENRTIGVIELFEKNEKLTQQINKNIILIWIIMTITGIVLYLLLFIIFFNAHKRQKRTDEELIQTQDATIFALAYLSEIRDIETGKHLERTALYVKLLAIELKKHSLYKKYIDNTYINDLLKSAPLHDIGKVGVPDKILNKPEKLTPQEFEEMKKHCEYGAQVLKEAEKKLKFQSFLKIAIKIIYSHHEKWDGTGYPLGLKGDEIPLSARMMALADVYDALRTKRPYKEALSHETSYNIILQERGKHFDPVIVDAFTCIEARFNDVSKYML
ncbi:MAG: HD domain-containing protein [Spirochaetales bacterium]|nr:HD domain-containing protein [Spirochaetales bacterium]